MIQMCMLLCCFFLVFFLIVFFYFVFALFVFFVFLLLLFFVFFFAQKGFQGERGLNPIFSRGRRLPAGVEVATWWQRGRYGNAMM